MTKFHKPIYPHSCSSKATIDEIISAIQANDGFPVVLINDDKSLFGVASSGDIARFLGANPNVRPFEVQIEEAANQSPTVGHERDSFETISSYLRPERVRTLPILDSNRCVSRIATRQANYIQIGKHRIDEYAEPYLIAEVGVNHNGDINEAIHLIQAARDSGCQAVKFQHRSRDLYNTEQINSFDLGTQYIIAEIDRTRLNISSLVACCNRASEIGLDVIITPFDENALEEITSSPIPLAALKIASCDLTNTSLIQACTSYGLPVILSTGMSYEREIVATASLLKSLFAEYSFLHCNSTYPAPPSDVNLKYIPRLRELCDAVVGYSSHDGNIAIPVASIAIGAKIVEFHITRSRDLQGTDHRASIEVSEVPKLVNQCKLINSCLGYASPRIPSQGELANRQSLGKSYALINSRSKGHVLTSKDLRLISPGSGYTVDDRDQLIGKPLARDVQANKLLNKRDILDSLEDSEGLSRAFYGLYNLGYITGIPLRYHDAIEMIETFDPPLVEFHMSDRDLSLNPSDFLTQVLPEIHLIVHAVEQFEDGFIFDLASRDKTILQRSLQEIERLTSHLDKLRCFFKPTQQIPIVINIGGFTTDRFLQDREYFDVLNRAAESLELIGLQHQGYVFMPQTMPPFPWHQGGRSFHNLLTSLAHLDDFLKITSNPICFDVSHSALSCSYFNENLLDHVSLIDKRIAHIHLSDAQGTNAEGLEVGEGSINFRKLHEKLRFSNKPLYMIPEIWQGHLHGGLKFSRSIKRFYEMVK